MNQKKKVLLVLYYQGPCSTNKISDMLGHCPSTTMNSLKRMGFVTMNKRSKCAEQGVRSLNSAGENVAEMIKKDVSLWTYVKLCLGVRVW